MPTDTKLKELIINELTEEQYNALTPNENELYLTPDNSTPDTKTISLFGNHSILVPKDSTDTNIDLYNHAIKISGSITSGETTTNLKVYTTITSSNNLEIDSITDLNTILGSSYEVMCSGFYGANSVISISKTAEGNPSFGYNNNGGESLISFSKFTNLVIKDTVKTV